MQKPDQSSGSSKKSKYPKIFQCTGYGDCKMTFSRSEHLARHIRKHTGERPFRCHCNRYFSRLDNLRQHIQTVHANEHHILHAAPPSPLPHSNRVAPQQISEKSHSNLNSHQQHPHHTHPPPPPPPPPPHHTHPQQQSHHNHPSHHLQSQQQPLPLPPHPYQYDPSYIYHHQQPFHTQPPLPPLPPNTLPNSHPEFISVTPQNNNHTIIIEHNQPFQNHPTPYPPPSFEHPIPFKPKPLTHRPSSLILQNPEPIQHIDANTPLYNNFNTIHSTPSIESLASTPTSTNFPIGTVPHPLSSRHTPSIASLDSVTSFKSSLAYPPLPPLPTTPTGFTPAESCTPSNTVSSPSLDPASTGFQSSNVTTPLSNRSSWLSSVLCDSSPTDENRPRTWGPSSNSTALFKNKPSSSSNFQQRSSMPLVKISEDSISSDEDTQMSGSDCNGPIHRLPSFSTLLNKSIHASLPPLPASKTQQHQPLSSLDQNTGSAVSTKNPRRKCLSKPLPPLPFESTFNTSKTSLGTSIDSHSIRTTATTSTCNSILSTSTANTSLSGCSISKRYNMKELPLILKHESKELPPIKSSLLASMQQALPPLPQKEHTTTFVDSDVNTSMTPNETTNQRRSSVQNCSANGIDALLQAAGV